MTTSGFVACPECKEETVNIVTKAIHTSCEYVEHGLNGYLAYNTDSSWKAKDNTAKFVCDSCGHKWPVDHPVEWEWID